MKSVAKLAVIGALLALQVGCAAFRSVTTVVLVEDPNGKVGRVLVEDDKTRQVKDITQKNTAAIVGTNKATVKDISQQQISKKFGSVLKSEPTPPKRIKLHFDSGSSEVVAADMPLFEAALTQIKSRQSCDISVIGNSDSEGDYESNKKLSLERAEAVAKTLLAKGIDQKCLDVRFYADNDPIVPTAKGVGHPLNRRVEIEVR